MKEEVKGLTAVMLRRVGEKAVVEVEINGVWVEVIEEQYNSAFSHIVEGSAIKSLYEKDLARKKGQS